MEGATCDVKACRICFAADCKLYPMIAYKILHQAYETITGLLLEDDGILLPYLCSDCGIRLLNCSHFRTTSLQAHSRLMEVVKNHGYLTPELIESVKGTDSLLTWKEADNDNKTGYDLGIVFMEENSDEETDIMDSADLDEGVIKVEKHEEDKEILSEDPLNIDIAIGNVKSEKKLTMKQDSADGDSNSADMKSDGDFLGEGYSSDDCRPLGDARRKAELKSIGVVVKVPKVSPPAEVDSDSNAVENDRLVNCVFSCQMCSYRTNSDVRLITHLKAHAASDSYSCNLCSYITIHKHNLTCHYKTHSSEKPHSCEVCSKGFRQKSGLVEHMRVHSGEKSYSCDVCDKAFSNNSALTKHSTTHSDEKSYSCHICKKLFKIKANLSKHMRTHSSVKPYSCNVCHKAFRRRSNLTTHFRIHSGEKPYSCNICCRAFTRKAILLNHLDTHSGKKDYVCNICNKGFVQKYNLTAHLRTHSVEKPSSGVGSSRKLIERRIFKSDLMTESSVNSCNVCNKTFNYKPNLTKHMRTHSGEKPYSCDVCRRSFSLRVTLTNHLRTHSGEKPFSCNVCHKSFIQRSNLISHSKIHSGEKSYSCDVCNKSFTQKSNLTVHLKTHSSEKLYSCNICSKTFKYQATLKKHSRKHSVEK